MKVPRLLLVVLVVVLVFGVGSCGVAVLRRDEAVTPDGIPDILGDLAPEPPPVDLADVTACAPLDASGRIAFSATCRVGVARASGSVRRLSLRNDGGSGVRLVLSEPASAERDLDPGESEVVDVPPDEPAEIDLVCLGVACRVRLGA